MHLDYNPKWSALAVAQAVSILAVAITHPSVAGFFVAILNGFLVYSTAIGANAISGTPPPGARERGGLDATEPRRIGRTFLTRWF